MCTRTPYSTPKYTKPNATRMFELDENEKLMYIEEKNKRIICIIFNKKSFPGVISYGAAIYRNEADDLTKPIHNKKKIKQQLRQTAQGRLQKNCVSLETTITDFNEIGDFLRSALHKHGVAEKR